jgi:hypothetical protein
VVDKEKLGSELTLAEPEEDALVGLKPENKVEAVAAVVVVVAGADTAGVEPKPEKDELAVVLAVLVGVATVVVGAELNPKLAVAGVAAAVAVGVEPKLGVVVVIVENSDEVVPAVTAGDFGVAKAAVVELEDAFGKLNEAG